MTTIERLRPLIQLQGVAKQYGRGAGAVTALDGLDLDVREGEFVAITGPSGAGKSTLLNLLAGIEKPSAGGLSIGGQNLTSLSRRQLSQWRADTIGFIYQAYNLVSVLTVLENTELPGFTQSYSASERRERALRALRLVGMDVMRNRFPDQLSGGERQRVAIARAILTMPRLLLCDEPTGNLDRENAEAVLRILRKLVDEHDRTVLLVTHDMAAAEVADRVIELQK